MGIRQAEVTLYLGVPLLDVMGGVHVNDLNATILRQLGIDHERFTYPYLGLDQRLTGVEEARVVREILA